MRSRDVQNAVLSENETFGLMIRSGRSETWVYLSRERERERILQR